MKRGNLLFFILPFIIPLLFGGTFALGPVIFILLTILIAKCAKSLNKNDASFKKVISITILTLLTIISIRINTGSSTGLALASYWPNIFPQINFSPTLFTRRIYNILSIISLLILIGYIPILCSKFKEITKKQTIVVYYLLPLIILVHLITIPITQNMILPDKYDTIEVVTEFEAFLPYVSPSNDGTKIAYFTPEKEIVIYDLTSNQEIFKTQVDKERIVKKPGHHFNGESWFTVPNFGEYISSNLYINKILNFDVQKQTFPIIEWSPDDKKVLFSEVKKLIYYNISTKQEIEIPNLYQYDGRRFTGMDYVDGYTWLNNNEIIFSCNSEKGLAGCSYNIFTKNLSKLKGDIIPFVFNFYTRENNKLKYTKFHQGLIFKGKTAQPRCFNSIIDNKTEIEILKGTPHIQNGKFELIGLSTGKTLIKNNDNLEIVNLELKVTKKPLISTKFLFLTNNSKNRVRENLYFFDMETKELLVIADRIFKEFSNKHNLLEDKLTGNILFYFEQSESRYNFGGYNSQNLLLISPEEKYTKIFDAPGTKINIHNFWFSNNKIYIQISEKDLVKIYSIKINDIKFENKLKIKNSYESENLNYCQDLNCMNSQAKTYGFQTCMIYDNEFVTDCIKNAIPESDKAYGCALLNFNYDQENLPEYCNYTFGIK